MSDDDMRNWHREFEAREPQAHQDFLESLNLDTAEIERIRRWSQANETGQTVASGFEHRIG